MSCKYTGCTFRIPPASDSYPDTNHELQRISLTKNVTTIEDVDPENQPNILGQLSTVVIINYYFFVLLL